MKFDVVKQIRVRYTIEAEGPDEALAAEPPADATIEVLRQRARDTGRKPAAGRPALVDRELRPGRKLVAHYKKVEWQAEVETDGQIALRRKGGHAETFGSLNKAAMHVTDKASVNAWALFRDPPAAEPEEPTEATPAEEPTEPAAKPKGKRVSKKKLAAPRFATARLLAASALPAPPSVPPTDAKRREGRTQAKSEGCIRASGPAGLLGRCRGRSSDGGRRCWFQPHRSPYLEAPRLPLLCALVTRPASAHLSRLRTTRY